ncbi:MAG: 4-hydroxythreonine-4-phosphate dehydrogenase PdxA [Gammaproteobacteria bacterium]|nr:4-hydroxythreonine-4-phosphate dehydrogenase PdxA [Gammaproteobacteria bacterium]MDH5594253.1 4-hydroxythreonine-4-phosphate dehydrogenase PdxA [Gammaproteobacteria bacterium]MDH5614084.1 4-hydroxythreonine-4-phosphate dehydrogenase PdxA [Gammaproteobacteria bacterium]
MELLHSKTRRLVLTPGEPAGIGPDLCIQLAQQSHKTEFVFIADPDLLHQRAEQLHLNIETEILDPETEATSSKAGYMKIIPASLSKPVIAGKLDSANARYVLNTLDIAHDLVTNRKADALVTGPVQKSVINDAGIPFTGHTEYLSELASTEQVVMMLAIPALKVALATTHLPLAKVSQALTPELLEKIIIILNQSLKKDFGILQPEILVCGLNPHAGENGHLGEEEINIIQPVINKLLAKGLRLSNPTPADTAFIKPNIEKYDAFLAMYHDQGLPILKHLGFGEAVNITLGLPYIRTSVDHGTALSLAGTGTADDRSLRYAIDVALEMIHHRRNH